MAMVVGKRPAETALVESSAKRSGAIVASKPARFSELMAPIMKLEGHQAAVHSMKFAPNGVYLATAGFDKLIYIWEVFGECPHVLTLTGHKNSVQEVQFSPDSETIYSASADSTVMVWDAETGQRIKKVTGHDSFVNSVCPARRGPPLFVSGSDDGTTKLWDQRACRKPQLTFKQQYQVTAVALSDHSDQIFAGSLDNTIRCWDIRSGKTSEDPEPIYSLTGHTDTVTGISVSPDGSYLLSNAMDNTAKIWDVRPFVAGGERLSKEMRGHQHNYEKLLLKASWSPDGTLVGVASADCLCYVFDTAKPQLPKYQLPGHKGSVNEVAFHPTQPILGSCSSDHSVYLGEIDYTWDTSGAAGTAATGNE